MGGGPISGRHPTMEEDVMVRTVVLTILIVIGAAIGGYALWTSSQSDGEAVAVSCEGTEAIACASTMAAGCGDCPSGVVEGTALMVDGGSAIHHDGCTGNETHASCDGCADDADCAHDGECLCDGDPASCTEEIRAACDDRCASHAEIETVPACGAGANGTCDGGRCGSRGASVDAS